MYQVEIRSGMQVVREFNLSEQRLWLEILAPLMAGEPLEIEGHEFAPRETRLKVYEGPELRPDQLGMGRGWQNVERTATDVTDRVLTRAREHTAASASAASGTPTARTAPAVAMTAAAAASDASAAANIALVGLLRERLIGRLSAGPIGGEELLRIAAELLPDGDERLRALVAGQAVWALLERDVAQLAPSER